MTGKESTLISFADKRRSIRNRIRELKKELQGVSTKNKKLAFPMLTYISIQLLLLKNEIARLDQKTYFEREIGELNDELSRVAAKHLKQNDGLK
jgi:hypothetical protein